ncbi:hypothetical protein J6590_017151 [Homalodisca vitripennis]|nr:hypothetical protein J6590_017151 [Homalodisca vitripennis]
MYKARRPLRPGPAHSGLPPPTWSQWAPCLTVGVEQSNSGKPLILYNKYRESHCLKMGKESGDVWVKNVERRRGPMPTINNIKHHGPRPITIRTLSLSPPPTRSTASSAATCLTSVPSGSAEPSTPPACVSVPVASLGQDVATPVVSFGTARCLSAMEVADLVAENQQLKHRLMQLEEQYKHVFDHSIESDTLLMQYTNQVFVAATSLVESPVRASVADCAA